MAVLSLKVQDKQGNTVCVSSGENYVSLVCTAEYQEGDFITFECSEKNVHVWIQVDDALGPALCYITGNIYYHIPFEEKRIAYSPKVFSGKRHYLYAKVASDSEVAAYRNLALNVMDQHGETNCYPHAWANVETRGEAVFAARNAIDGVRENRSHGEWPYQSWGINRREDAEITVEFGREVWVDKIVLVTRADFPHDNWWREATLTFSGGVEMVVTMEKSVLPHVFEFPARKTSFVKLSNLIKSDEPSPFPALTQIEAYGHEIL